MPMSNMQAVGVALIPGFAESCQSIIRAEPNGYMLDGTFTVMKISRNVLYVGVSLTAIGIVAGASIWTPEAVIGGAVVATLGIGITTFTGKILYEQISFLKDNINARCSRST